MIETRITGFVFTKFKKKLFNKNTAKLLWKNRNSHDGDADYRDGIQQLY